MKRFSQGVTLLWRKGVSLSGIYILATPYVFFSIFYQWRIAQQWCILCLLIQTLLILQLIVNLYSNFYDATSIAGIPFLDILSYAMLFMFILTTMVISVPALKKAKSNRLKTIELQRIKHNPLIFEALLSRQKIIPSPLKSLTISKGNANGKFKILKVCNPYCGPCAKAHPILEELVNNNDEIGLDIIFTATVYENDYKREPVKHFMSIASKNDPALTEVVLNDWYNSPDKNYKEFAEKYPVDQDLLNAQEEKIKGMHDWCDEVNVSSTPTFFINGQKLPDIYTVSDLKYFLTV